MTLSGFRAFIDKQNWIFAKTYANKAPHEYCLKEKLVGSEQEFLEAIQFIQAEGITMYWYKNKRQYLFLDGRMYWTMSPDPLTSNLINRCQVADYDIKMSISWRGNK